MMWEWWNDDLMKERMIQLKREERGLSNENGSASSSDRFRWNWIIGRWEYTMFSYLRKSLSISYFHPDNYNNRYDKDNNSKWNTNDSSSWMSVYDIE